MITDNLLDEFVGPFFGLSNVKWISPYGCIFPLRHVFPFYIEVCVWGVSFGCLIEGEMCIFAPFKLGVQILPGSCKTADVFLKVVLKREDLLLFGR